MAWFTSSGIAKAFSPILEHSKPREFTKTFNSYFE